MLCLEPDMKNTCSSRVHSSACRSRFLLLAPPALQCRHSCVCIRPSEGPLDAAFLAVAAQRPAIHLGGEGGVVWQTPVKALTVDNANLCRYFG